MTVIKEPGMLHANVIKSRAFKNIMPLIAYMHARAQRANAGNTSHTLQNALLGKDPTLAALPRAGIIHRLDKDTSGLLVVARTPRAHTALARQLLARSVARDYLAICVGVMTGGGRYNFGVVYQLARSGSSW